MIVSKLMHSWSGFYDLSLLFYLTLSVHTIQKDIVVSAHRRAPVVWCSGFAVSCHLLSHLGPFSAS